MRSEERREARANSREILGTVELYDDADGLPFATAVEELLREREVHDDDVLVELARALRLGTRNLQAHDVRGTARGRGQEVKARRVSVVAGRDVFVRQRREIGGCRHRGGRWGHGARRTIRDLDVR